MKRIIFLAFLLVVAQGCTTYRIIGQNVEKNTKGLDVVAIDSIDIRGTGRTFVGKESLIEILQISMRKYGFKMLDREQYLLEKKNAGLVFGKILESKDMIELSKFTQASHLLVGWMQREVLSDALADEYRVTMHLALYELSTGRVVREAIIYSPEMESLGARELQKISNISVSELFDLQKEGVESRESLFIDLLWNYGIKW